MDSLISVTRSACSVRIMASWANSHRSARLIGCPRQLVNALDRAPQSLAALQGVSPIRDIKGSDKIGL